VKLYTNILETISVLIPTACNPLFINSIDNIVVDHSKGLCGKKIRSAHTLIHRHRHTHTHTHTHTEILFFNQSQDIITRIRREDAQHYDI